MSIDLSGLESSANTLIRTVDALGSDELAAPSLLPGWTRAHVVAHLALNGTALAGVMDAILREEPVAMYESDEQRDTDIEELAGAEQADLLDHLLAATTQFLDAARAMDEKAWTGTFSRTPGADPVPAARIPSMRRYEIEIHHADLGAVYARQDWPQDFVARGDGPALRRPGRRRPVHGVRLGPRPLVGGRRSGRCHRHGHRRRPRLVAHRPRRGQRTLLRRRRTA